MSGESKEYNEREAHVIPADIPTGQKRCPVCKAYIPTDHYWDAIYPSDIHYCYWCGAKLEVKEE